MNKIIEDLQRDIRNLKTRLCCMGGSIVELTKAELDTLISTEALVPGQLYKISGVDVDLYGGTDILIKAATTSELELSGHGIFYNPKYLNSRFTLNNGYGIYDKYVFFTTVSRINTINDGEIVTANNGATGKFRTYGALELLTGSWVGATSLSVGGKSAVITVLSSPVSYIVGSNVIWGGKHWTNTTGNRGSSVDNFTLDATNWEVVPFNDTDYNVEIDEISYDYSNNLIVSRKDRWNNYVTFTKNVIVGYDRNPIKIFQWGNYPENNITNSFIAPGVTSNSVNDSLLDCINFRGRCVKDNILSSLSELDTFITNNESQIFNNTLKDAYIYNNTLRSCQIYNNQLYTYSGIFNNINDNGNFWGNLFDYGIIKNNYFTGSEIFGTKINSSEISSNSFSSSNIYNNMMYDSSDFKNTTYSNCTIRGVQMYISRFDFSSGGTVSSKNIQFIEANYAIISTNISAATILFGDYPKRMFRNSSGVVRLGYYNGSDVFTIVNVNA